MSVRLFWTDYMRRGDEPYLGRSPQLG